MKLRVGLPLLALAVVLSLTACSGSKKGSAATTTNGTAAGGQASGKPVTIGISLSLSGDFSDEGKAAMRGYKLWRTYQNAHGGLLGRPVKLKIVDDTSSPNQAVSNYENLITHDKVDLVFGPFSTLLTAPSANIAHRYGYAFIEPAGGGPSVFAAKLNNIFFAQPAPAVKNADVLADYILSLPKSERPKTAAYPMLDDPFAAPPIQRLQQRLQAAGIKTVYSKIYPAELTDWSPIVAALVKAKPDLVAAGTQNVDGYAITKGLVQLKYNPKFLYVENGANDPLDFPGKVGAANTAGIMSSGDWFPSEKSVGNTQFKAAYTKAYGGTAQQIDTTSAEAYACGQILAAAVQQANSLDNATLIKTLHAHTYHTVNGTIGWNQFGEPKGNTILVQWVGGKLTPVYPSSVAEHAPIKKPAWGQ